MENDDSFLVEQQGSRRPANFIDVLYRLPEKHSLLLSRNQVTVIDAGGLGEEKPVHYRGIYESVREKSSEWTGVTVNEDYYDSVKRLIHDEEREERKAPAYPILTVTNADTGESVSEQISIVKRLMEDDIEILAGPPDLQGRRLDVKLGVLARQMAGQVGLDANTTIVMSPKKGRLFDEALPKSELLIKDAVQIEGVEGYLPISTIGEVALGLLQMSIADAFRDSPLRRGIATVELILEPLPDMNALMMDLIDLVEANEDFLLCQKERINGELNFALYIVSENRTVWRKLVHDSSIAMAVYNAFDVAMNNYPSSRF